MTKTTSSLFDIIAIFIHHHEVRNLETRFVLILYTNTHTTICLVGYFIYVCVCVWRWTAVFHFLQGCNNKARKKTYIYIVIIEEASYLRCGSETVVVGQRFNASGFASCNKTRLISKIDTNHRHFVGFARSLCFACDEHFALHFLTRS